MKLNLKKTALIFIVSISLNSCAIKSYEYVFKLNKPNQSESLKFNDDKIELSFTFNSSDVSFNLKNNSDRPIKIIWDDASFVKNGEAQKIMHKNVKYTDKEKAQAPTVIPIGSFVQDVVAPIDDIKLNQKYDYYTRKSTLTWSHKPFFPSYNYNNDHKRYIDEKIKPIKGQKFNIYLPIQYDGKVLEYYFEFEVSDILIRKNKNEANSIFTLER